MKLNLNRIKAERIAKGLTQAEISKLMGWKSRAPYAKRENGIIDFGVDELGKFIKVIGYNDDKITDFFTKNVL